MKSKLHMAAKINARETINPTIPRQPEVDDAEDIIKPDEGRLEAELQKLKVESLLIENRRRESIDRRRNNVRDNLDKRLKDRKAKAFGVRDLGNEVLRRPSFRARHLNDIATESTNNDNDDDEAADDEAVQKILKSQQSRRGLKKKTTAVFALERTAEEAEVQLMIELERRRAKAQKKTEDRLKQRLGFDPDIYLASSEESVNESEESVSESEVSNNIASSVDDNDDDSAEEITVKVKTKKLRKTAKNMNRRFRKRTKKGKSMKPKSSTAASITGLSSDKHTNGVIQTDDSSHNTNSLRKGNKRKKKKNTK